MYQWMTTFALIYGDHCQQNFCIMQIFLVTKKCVDTALTVRYAEVFHFHGALLLKLLTAHCAADLAEALPFHCCT